MDRQFSLLFAFVMLLVIAWVIKYLHDDHARSRERATSAAEDYALQLREYNLRRIPEDLYKNQMEVRRLRRSPRGYFGWDGNRAG
jgi:hypothetical protein